MSSGGGIWQIAQGGTGLSTVFPNSFFTVNASNKFETEIPMPLQNNFGGTGYSTFPSNKFLSIDSGGSLIANYNVPTSAFVDLSGTQTLTNKVFSDTTYFLGSPTVFTFGGASGYNVNWVAPLSTTALSIKDPGTDTDFLFTNGTQSLFNKTLTHSSNIIAASSFKHPSGTIATNTASATAISQYLTANSASVATWQFPKSNPWFAQTVTLTLVYSQLSTGASMESATGSGTLIIPSVMRAAGLTAKLRYRGYFRPNGDTAAYTLTFNTSIGGVALRSMAVSYTNVNQNNSFDIEIVSWFVTATTVISWITYVGQNGSTSVFNQTNTATATPITIPATAVGCTTSVNLTGGTGPNCQLIIYSVTLDLLQP